MRVVALVLAMCSMASCASNPGTATKADCRLDEDGVYASMLGTSWRRLFVTDPEPVVHGTFVTLSYLLNLDPDPMADRRDYAGLADHGSLSITFGSQFPMRAGRPDEFVVEVRGIGRSMARRRNHDGQAWFRGDDLNEIFGGAGDVHVVLLNAEGDVVREERISRSELVHVDATMRRLSSRIREILVDPERLCAPEEVIVVT